MNNTSMGYHTFSFFQRLTARNYNSLESAFIGCMNDYGEMKRSPIENKKNLIKAGGTVIGRRTIGWEYTYKDRSKKGIRWRLLSMDVSPSLTIYGVTAIITPRVLIENNYIAAATADDLGRVEDIFNREATKISPILSDFGLCSVNRLDPCLNLDLHELGLPCTPKQLINLFKRADIPNHYTERKVKYSKRNHRREADEDSFYLESGSANVNYYWKYPKITDGHPDYFNRENYRNVIRLEIECMYAKLYLMSRHIRKQSKYHTYYDGLTYEELLELMGDGVSVVPPSNPIDVLFTDNVSEEVICKYFYKVIRKGDYFTLDGARWMVEAYNFRREKRERMIYALELINECGGIAKAKSKVLGVDRRDFKRSLKDLDDIMVNPVTIPRRWNIEHIPNPLRAYFDSIYEEQVLTSKEVKADRLLTEYLS